MVSDCLIAFGSNLGESEACFHHFLREWQNDCRVNSLVASQLVTTRPVGGSGLQNDYQNGCLRFLFHGSANELMDSLHAFEQKFGRVRGKRWESRTIDLDVILFGNEVLERSGLQIPHPRMSFRRFVLQPAVEIGGEMLHPLSGLQLREHLDILDHRPDQIVFFANPEILDPELLDKCQRMVESAEWQFELIFESERILAETETIKLLVFFEGLSAEQLQVAKGFRGASLDCRKCPSATEVLELEAAIAAMQPI